MTDAQKAVKIATAAKKMSRALELLMEARDVLNAAGAYEDDQMFTATSNLTDAISGTSTAYTSIHMAAFNLVRGY